MQCVAGAVEIVVIRNVRQILVDADQTVCSVAI